MAIGTTTASHSFLKAYACDISPIRLVDFESCKRWKLIDLQERIAIVDPTEKMEVGREDAETQAMACFQRVLDSGPKIDLEHQLVYYARMSSFVSFDVRERNIYLALIRL